MAPSSAYGTQRYGGPSPWDTRVAFRPCPGSAMNARLLSTRLVAGLCLASALPAAPPAESAAPDHRQLRRTRAVPAPEARTAAATDATSGPVLNLASNYAFTTNTTGSLTDMSSGTTLLIRGGQVDAVSPVTPIGFDFYFQ